MWGWISSADNLLAERGLRGEGGPGQQNTYRPGASNSFANDCASGAGEQAYWMQTAISPGFRCRGTHRFPRDGGDGVSLPAQKLDEFVFTLWRYQFRDRDAPVWQER